jgi:folate-binding Fe-S cluster repair protein YgfZ
VIREESNYIVWSRCEFDSSPSRTIVKLRFTHSADSRAEHESQFKNLKSQI